MLSTSLFSGAVVSTAFASFILGMISWRYFYTITLVPCLIISVLISGLLKGAVVVRKSIYVNTFIPTLRLGQTRLTPVASTTQFFFCLLHWKCIPNKTKNNNKSQKRLCKFWSGATTTNTRKSDSQSHHVTTLPCQ